MMNKGLVFSSFQSIRHQIITIYVHRQEIQILKLLDALKSHQLGLENKQYHHIKKIRHCEKDGSQIQDQMIKERFQIDITVANFCAGSKKAATQLY